MSTRDLWLNGWAWSEWPLAAAGLAIVVYGLVLRGRAHRKPGLFLAAVLVFLLTLVSPLETLGHGYLFSAHMVQHLLLLLIVPALGLQAWPPARASVAKRRGTTRVRTRALTHPVTTWLAGMGAMWLWHEPTLCNAASTGGPVRSLQVFSLLLLGTLFWWPILCPDGSRRLSPLAGVVYLFTACLGCTVLGIIITFSPVSVCPVFAQPHHNHRLMSLIQEQWGITPALDQQVGGLMMWVPACGIYVVSIMALLARWYYGSEPESTQSNAAQPSPTNT